MPASRFLVIDALRGACIVWMTVFHLCFDLTYFGYIRQNFYDDPFWTWQRAAIVGLFVFTAGLGQALAVAQKQSWPRFWRRWALVAGGALLVSGGSYLMYPASFIYFGILHGIAAMLVVVRLTAGWGRWLVLLGGLAMVAPELARHAHGIWPSLEWLNDRIFNWLGLVSRKPVTEDYAPLLPWLGVMWWGMVAGQWVLRNRPGWLATSLPKPMVALAVLGRWSLTYYLLHQPILLGGLLAFAKFGRGPGL